VHASVTKIVGDIGFFYLGILNVVFVLILVNESEHGMIRVVHGAARAGVTINSNDYLCLYYRELVKCQDGIIKQIYSGFFVLSSHMTSSL
jgi:hypothetical protein